MCFTLSVQVEKSKLEKLFNARFKTGIEFSPFYFKSAFENPIIPVITSQDNSSFNSMHWGLIPHWVKNQEQANEIRVKTYNARLENIYEKPSFKYASQVNRCIIPASGFFEWQEVNRKKIPWFIFPKNDKIFSLAGIWNAWANPNTGEIQDTFTIITQPANELMSKIHNTKKRMPVILPDSAVKLWLSNSISTSEYSKILNSIDSSSMNAYTVSSMVSNSRIDRNIPEVIIPYNYQLPEQKLLF